MTAADPPVGPERADPLADDAVVRATFESAPDGLVVVTAAGGILAFNRRFVALWSFPAEMLARRNAAEMRAFTASQVRDPQAYLDSLPRLAATVRSGVFDVVELRDGRVFERHVSPLQLPDVQGALVVRWRDVTAQRQAEQALAVTQARAAAFFDRSVYAKLLADDQGRVLEANRAACQLLGYERTELLGCGLVDLFAPEHSDWAAEWQVLLHEGSLACRVPVRRRDGALVETQCNGAAHVRPGEHLVILTDLTEELRSQQRQQELTALLELVMLDADMVYWDIDLVGDRVSAAGQHMYRMLGYEPHELADTMQAWDDLVHPDDAPARDLAWNEHVLGHRPYYESDFRMRHRDGHWVWLHGRGRAVARDANGVATRMVGMRINITRRKEVEARLESMAHTDALTGVLNRRRFTELASTELARAHRHGIPVALMMMDLDHFKQVNDRLGHAGGDAVLRSFAATAQHVVRQGDVFGRIGGEEFAALLPMTTLDGAQVLAQRLCQSVRALAVEFDGHGLSFSVSIGVAAWNGPDHGEPSFDRLMVAADRALYTAKAEGRDRVVAAPAAG
jgi:diguanylate cyclase (GGDEF)-like protein/PAS domain S-box-containing protein